MCQKPDCEGGQPTMVALAYARASDTITTKINNGAIMPTDFRNEPLTDFSKEKNAQAMRAAIEKVRTQLGNEHPLVIGGERIKTDSKLESVNPANRTQVVGRFQKA